MGKHACAKEDTLKNISDTLKELNNKMDIIKVIQIKVEILEKDLEYTKNVIDGNGTPGIKSKMMGLEKAISNLEVVLNNINLILDGEGGEPGLKTRLSNLYVTVGFVTTIGGVIGGGLVYSIINYMFK